MSLEVVFVILGFFLLLGLVIIFGKCSFFRFVSREIDKVLVNFSIVYIVVSFLYVSGLWIFFRFF